MKIRGKIYSIVAVLGLAACVITGMGIHSLGESSQHTEELDRAAQRAFFVERVNHLITAVNAGTRGVHSSISDKEMTDYVEEIRKNSDAMLAAIEEWRKIVPAERLASFEEVVKNATDYRDIRMRLGLLGAKEGSMAAKTAINADPSIKQNRIALQKSLDEQRESIRASIEPLRAGMAEFEARTRMLLIGTCHIGEVQASQWDKDTVDACQKAGILLL